MLEPVDHSAGSDNHPNSSALKRITSAESLAHSCAAPGAPEQHLRLELAAPVLGRRDDLVDAARIRARVPRPRGASGSGTPYPAALPSGERSSLRPEPEDTVGGVEQPFGIRRGPAARRTTASRYAGGCIPATRSAGAHGRTPAALPRDRSSARAARSTCVLEVEADVDGDLIVARATGVNPLADVAEVVRQPELDRAVHILVRRADGELAGVDRAECGQEGPAQPPRSRGEITRPRASASRCPSEPSTSQRNRRASTSRSSPTV